MPIVLCIRTYSYLKNIKISNTNTFPPGSILSTYDVYHINRHVLHNHKKKLTYQSWHFIGCSKSINQSQVRKFKIFTSYELSKISPIIGLISPMTSYINIINQSFFFRILIWFLHKGIPLNFRGFSRDINNRWCISIQWYIIKVEVEITCLCYICLKVEIFFNTLKYLVQQNGKIIKVAYFEFAKSEFWEFVLIYR